MANNTRQNIDRTLLAQLQSAAWGNPASQTTWQIPASMHFRPWDGVGKVDPTDQPCLFLRRITEDVSSPAYGINKYVFDYEVWIYLQVDNANPQSNPYDGIDQIVDAIDAVIAPSPPFSQNNLSNLVVNCRISGKIYIADGVDNGQAVIRIPIQVFTGS
jgi:hypothetical protein